MNQREFIGVEGTATLSPSQQGLSLIPQKQARRHSPCQQIPSKNGNHPSEKGVSGFPGGAVLKNLPANAGDRFEPWSGKIPHAVEQLSPCTTTTEPAL